MTELPGMWDDSDLRGGETDLASDHLTSVLKLAGQDQRLYAAFETWEAIARAVLVAGYAPGAPRCICIEICEDECVPCNHSGRDLEEGCIGLDDLDGAV